MSKKSTKTDFDRLDRMKDKDIDYSDIPPLDDSFFKKVTAEWPPAKKQVTVRIDSDVLAWLRGLGKGYQTRINHILRAAMDSQPAQRPPKAEKPKSTRSGAKPRS